MVWDCRLCSSTEAEDCGSHKTRSWKQVQLGCWGCKRRLGLCIRHRWVIKVERETGAGNLILILRASVYNMKVISQFGSGRNCSVLTQFISKFPSLITSSHVNCKYTDIKIRALNGHVNFLSCYSIPDLLYLYWTTFPHWC